jgi:hypothetical protein
MVRWYPASWRSIHDTEFVTLLEDSIAERPFWPRRGAGIVWEGTRLRLIDFGQRAVTTPPTSLSPGANWLIASAILFLGYTLLFLSTASTAYAHGFEAFTAPLSTIGGSLVIAFGTSLLAVGVRTMWHLRPGRASWPLLVLGASLIGLVSTNWWFSSGKGLWGWTSISSVVAGLNPNSWTQVPLDANSWTHVPSGLSDVDRYLIANLVLLALSAVALIVICQRLVVSDIRRPRITTDVIVFLFLVLGAVTAGVWLWVIDLTGPSSSSLFIAWALTLSAISTLCAAMSRRWIATPRAAA